MSVSAQIELTPEQERFADEHGATASIRCCEDSAVCLYTQLADKTIRWIVNSRGWLLEYIEFDRG
jgi:hypothetical protein